MGIKRRIKHPHPFRSDLPVNPHMMKMARQIRGLTLDEVSEQSGVPVADIQRYESEGGVLPTHRMYGFAKGYRFPISFFFRKGEQTSALVCPARLPYQDILAPLQSILDEWVGDEEIAEIEWEDIGFLACWYRDDGDNEPCYAVLLGNTVKQAQKNLMGIIKRDRLAWVDAAKARG